jgi:hypothetical protein
LSCQLVVASPLVVLSLYRPLVLVEPAGCCIASHRPLITLPSHCLVAPAGCHIASRRPLVVPPSRQLVTPAYCRIASPRPLVAPHAALSSTHCTGWLLRHLLTHRPLVVSSSRRASCHLLLSCHASWLSHHHLSSSSCCTTPLVLSLCWLVVALPVLAPPSCPLIVVHHRCHRTPSNAAATIEHHRHRRH